MHIVKLTAPAHWSAFLLKHNSEYLTDNECRKVNNFIQRHGMGWPIRASDEVKLVHVHDALDEAGICRECLIYTFENRNDFPLKEKPPIPQCLYDAAPDLLDGCQFLIDQIENETLVRNIDRDGEDGWHMRMLKLMHGIQRASDAIKKAMGE